MLRSRPELLSLFLVVHLGNWFYGDANEHDFVESRVKSWKVERTSSPDFFTVNMKPTFRCLTEWCPSPFNAAYNFKVDGNYSYCGCICRKTGFTSFLPSMHRCINASMAASFAGNLVRRLFVITTGVNTRGETSQSKVENRKPAKL